LPHFNLPRCCPDNFVPVCGSNGKSYESYCLMQRDACLTGTHISLSHVVVCFQWERDSDAKRCLISASTPLTRAGIARDLSTARKLGPDSTGAILPKAISSMPTTACLEVVIYWATVTEDPNRKNIHLGRSILSEDHDYEQRLSQSPVCRRDYRWFCWFQLELASSYWGI
jgi:hypothetical protein